MIDEASQSRSTIDELLNRGVDSPRQPRLFTAFALLRFRQKHRQLCYGVDIALENTYCLVSLALSDSQLFQNNVVAILIQKNLAPLIVIAPLLFNWRRVVAAQLRCGVFFPWRGFGGELGAHVSMASV